MDFIKEPLNLNYFRRFGVEIEVNSFDMRNRPVGHQDGNLPEGIHYIGNLVQKITKDRVLIHKWGNDHHNDTWIVKPDGSCGMEVCTPVFKGWHGVIQTCKVIDAFKKDSKINADKRCSFHMHVDVSDLTDIELASILTWWIKCEPVFMDSVPCCRKKNQYCQFLGLMDMFDDIENGFFSPENLFRKLGSCKYYTVNTYHHQNKKRKTIEFRIMDHECCKDPWMVKNYIRLILHFVETAIKRGLPIDYDSGNKWSGYCWLDPFDVFDFLGFNVGDNCLSSGLQQVRRWFTSRLHQNARNGESIGVLGEMARSVSLEQIKKLNEKFNSENYISDEDIFGDRYRI
jgi:hypothetical protein